MSFLHAPPTRFCQQRRAWVLGIYDTPDAHQEGFWEHLHILHHLWVCSASWIVQVAIFAKSFVSGVQKVLQTNDPNVYDVFIHLLDSLHVSKLGFPRKNILGASRRKEKV